MAVLANYVYTGIREVKGKVKASEDIELKKYFTGEYKIDGITQGKVYNVVRAEGYGDCEDLIIIDDFGKEQRFGSFFFEEITDDENKSTQVKLKGIRDTDIIFWDIDGVLAKYDFPLYNKKVFEYHEWVKLNILNDVYIDVEPTTFFDDFINTNSNKQYILSVAMTSSEMESKIRFIQNKYKGIFSKNDIIFVSNGQYKVDALLAMSQKLNSYYRIVMIDDDASVMASIENLNNHKIRCFTLSDFL